jgi:hypothetical protein
VKTPTNEIQNSKKAAITPVNPAKSSTPETAEKIRKAALRLRFLNIKYLQAFFPPYTYQLLSALRTADYTPILEEKTISFPAGSQVIPEIPSKRAISEKSLILEVSYA